MLPTDRRLRPQDDGSYLVLIDGELIGRVYPFAHEELPSYFTTTKARQEAYAKRLAEDKWCAKLEHKEHRLGITFATSTMAAEKLTDSWLHEELRQRTISTLDDEEIVKLLEFEIRIYTGISMSDSIGTAARMEDFSHDYIEPLRLEQRDRERRKGGPG